MAIAVQVLQQDRETGPQLGLQLLQGRAKGVAPISGLLASPIRRAALYCMVLIRQFFESGLMISRTVAPYDWLQCP